MNQDSQIRVPRFTLHHGDCREVLQTLPDNYVDAIVTDPPYGLSTSEPDITEVLTHWLAGDDYHHCSSGFMGLDWDSFVPGPASWREAFRVLKPGGHALVFAGSRTQDLMTISLRLAGFEIRDAFRAFTDEDALSLFLAALTPDQQAAYARANAKDGGGLAWLYGSGFPKSHNVSAAIDKELAGRRKPGEGPTTPEAAEWDGWGTALKPGYEPIIVARKPLTEPTVARNVLKWKTGALHVAACRLPTDEPLRGGTGSTWSTIHNAEGRICIGGNSADSITSGYSYGHPGGRWPANVIHDGSAGIMRLFPTTAGAKAPGRRHTDDAEAGSTARFFYCAKATKEDRNEGLDDFSDAVMARSRQAQAAARKGDIIAGGVGAFNKARLVKNDHPTVKPTALMRWLCRLITPRGGVILDQYVGSGSTGKAAILEGFDFIGIDDQEKNVQIASARIEHALKRYLHTSKHASDDDSQLSLFADQS